MSPLSRILSALVTVATAVGANVVLMSDAHAYIDPGTGTMLLQMGGALIAAGLFYFRNARLWLGRVLGFGKTDVASRSDAEADATKQQ